MDYKVYDMKFILNSLIEKRLRGDKAYLLLVKFGYLRAALIYEPCAFVHGNQHLDFHALTEGWDNFTESGYKSMFFGWFNDDDSATVKVLTQNDIHDFLKLQCDSKLNLESPPVAQIQLL